MKVKLFCKQAAQENPAGRTELARGIARREA